MSVNKSKPVKVSLYTHNLEGGGAQRSIVQLANGLREIGFDICLILNEEKGVYFDEINSRIPITILGSRYRWQHVLRLSRFLKQEQPQILISTLVAPNYWSVLANLLAGRKTRLILREANVPHREFAEIGRKEKMGFRFAQRIYRFADAFVGNSEEAVESIEQFYKLDRDRISLIHNGIDTRLISELSAEDIRHPWFEDSNLKILVSIARVVPQKNIEMTIRTLSHLLKTDSNYRLLILGARGANAEYEALLEKLITENELSDKVDFLGFVRNPYPHLNRADLFVLSSRYEGFPSVLVQSLACGCPVVATDCGGAVREILNDGEFGPLVAVDDWEAMALAIVKSTENPTSSEILKARANDFSMEKTINGYNGLIQKLTGTNTN